MTCSKDFGRLLQAACLGLIGTLAFAGCGGSESKKDGGDAKPGDGGVPITSGPARLTVSTTSVALGTIDPATGGVGSVTVTNLGTQQTSGPISVVGSAGVAVSGCAGTALAPGLSCTVTIVVTPATTTGVFTGTVTISANPGASPTPITVSVNGTVVTPTVFIVAPPAIDLGSIPVGTAAPRQLITVTAKVNITDLQVSASGADVAIDQAATTCIAALAAGTSCTIAVNFQAATSGQKKDSVIITAGGAGAVTITVPITANVQAPPKLVIAPTTAQFQAAQGETSSAIGFGVANVGDVATGPLVVDISGTARASFAIQSNNCLALAALGTCTVTVVYRPTTASTQETATLSVTDSGGTATVSAALIGTPRTPSTLAITSTATDLGTVLVGSTGTAVAFTVTNRGDASSGTLSASVVSPDFLVTSDGCTGTALSSQGTCTILIALRPSSAGPKQATLTVVGTAAPTAYKDITGVGLIAGKLEASPASLDFQSVRVNKVGTEQTVTVTNRGGTATGAIVINKAGDFDVFPITSNTCSAPLPPLGTCAFAVNFAPKAAKGYSATYTVTDAASSATVTVSGAGLEQTGLTIAPSPVGACEEPDLTPEVDARPTVATAISTTQCFPATVVGATEAGTPITLSNGTVANPTTMTFVVTADSPLPPNVTDTGAITVALNPQTPADFTILTNGCTTALLAGASCQVTVAFTPTAVGLRQMSLVVTSANGGSDSATLQGLGLSLLEIKPLDLLEEGQAITGLDFGQVTVLGDAHKDHRYMLVARGPNNATARTTDVLTTLTDPTQPADFMYTTTSRVNPCNTTGNQAVTLNFATGAITGGQPSSWTWHGTAAGGGYPVFTCSFTVQFYPQSTKGDKTATLAATGSGSASDTKTLTGTATGPLTFNPSPANFARTFQVGESSNQTIVSMISLSGEDVTVTLKNHSTTTDYGPLSLTLGGANADQFMKVGDTCSTITLAHGAECYVTLAFVPTSAGAKTALLTANGGAESAQVVINGGAVDPFDITITPDQFVLANANVHDFGIVPQTANTAWAAFTITNPAGAPNSAQVDFGLLDPEGDDAEVGPDGTYSSAAYKLANGNNHAFGTCGNTGTTTLAPGASCTFWVQFMPSADDSVTTNPANALIGWIFATDKSKSKTVYVKGSGRVGSIITIAPATYAFPATAGGESSTTTLTVTNNGTAAFTMVIPPNTDLAPFNVNQGSQCVALGSLGAGATCQLIVRFNGIAGITQSTASEVDLTVQASGFADSKATTTLTGTSVVQARLVAVGYDNPDGEWSNTINLGGVRVGQVSGTVNLLFKNVGSVPTSTLNYAWQGVAENTQDEEFKIQPEDPNRCMGRTSLGPGQTCTVALFFQPSSTASNGLRDGKNFTLSAVTGGLVQVFRITATSLPQASGWIGIEGGAQAFHTFPGSAVGMDTGKPTTGFPTQVFQLTNHTASGVEFSFPAIDTNFTLITSGSSAGSAPCGALGGILDASNSCTFAVGFVPNDWTATTVYRHTTLSVGGFTGAVLGLYGRVQSIPQLTITPNQLSVTPDPYNFGQVVVNTDHNLSFTVTNTGETTSAAVVMGLTGADTSRFDIGGACTSTLAPQASCVGNVTYSAPTAAGAQVAVTLNATAGTVTSAVNPIIRAQPLNDTTLTVSPTTLSFPAQSVGTVSTEQTVVLSNNANSLTSGLLTIAIGDATNFSISYGSDCPVYTNSDATTGLVASGTCDIDVAFTPKTLGTGTFETDLTIRATPGSLKTIHITGIAQSALHITNSTLVNPATYHLTPTYAPYTLTVYLDPGAPTTSYIQTTLTGSNYMITEDQCVATKLSGGESCLIKVVPLFSSATPNQTADLTVNGGNAGNSATTTLNSAP